VLTSALHGTRRLDLEHEARNMVPMDLKPSFRLLDHSSNITQPLSLSSLLLSSHGGLERGIKNHLVCPTKLTDGEATCTPPFPLLLLSLPPLPPHFHSSTFLLAVHLCGEFVVWEKFLAGAVPLACSALCSLTVESPWSIPCKSYLLPFHHAPAL
jgi:hypothetical protein